MTIPPPRNFYGWSGCDMTFPLTTYSWLVCVPFPLGPVGKHAALAQEES